MVVLFWIISILLIACLIGEIRFRQLRTFSKTKRKICIGKWVNSIDKDMDVLDVESKEFVPTTKLSMRGSWRLAQDSMMDVDNFTEIKECEYSKYLY